MTLAMQDRERRKVAYSWLTWQHNRHPRFGAIGVAMLGLLLMIACGPRSTTSEGIGSVTDRVLVVDLPALYIDYAANGVAYVGSTPLADLGAAFARDLSALNVDESWIARLTAANIQHLQLLNTPTGVIVLVNGEALPSLGWDAAMLSSTAQLFQASGAEVAPVGALLPVVPEFGLGLVVRFPLAPDAVPIPVAAVAMTEELVAAATTGAQSAQAAYLALIGAPPELLIAVDYAADGTWTVAGMNATAWTQVIDAPWDRLTLSPTVVQKASAAGIQTVTITSTRQGLFVTINEQALPYIRWADGEMNQVVDLAQQLGLLGPLNENPHAETILTTVQNLLPFIQTLEVKLVVTFPA